MCYFISIGIQKDKSEEVLQTLGKNFEIEKTNNADFCANLENNQEAVTVSLNGCGCDLYKKIPRPTDSS